MFWNGCNSHMLCVVTVYPRIFPNIATYWKCRNISNWSRHAFETSYAPYHNVADFPTDLAAIPDFQSGAMENWGLTTYRETALLYNTNTSSASDKLRITMIIAHELAHQVMKSRSQKFQLWKLSTDQDKLAKSAMAECGSGRRMEG